MIRTGSIKNKLYLIIAFVVLLLLVLILNVFLQYKEQSLEDQINKAAALEKTFLAIIHDENVLIQEKRDENKAMLSRYEQFQEQFASSAGQAFSGVELIKQRRGIFQEFTQISRRSSRLFQTAHDTLEDLVESVRFIHQYHIAHLKNIAARGAMGELEIIEEAFERSAVQGASEVEIVESAVNVQAYLLDIFNTFEGMQGDHELSNVEAEFAENLNDFYRAVNQFEDYSLDSQDGLLVEELLINGVVIKDLFRSLVQNQQRMQVLNGELHTNEQQIVSRIDQLVETLRKRTDTTRTFIKTLQTLSQLVTILLVGWIIMSGRKIIRGLTRTVEETEKIQQDISYQIAGDPAYSDEFSIVYQALNDMAGQIHEHVQELQQARDTLEVRVVERTRELEDKNRALNESLEKIDLYSRMLRSELEKGRRMQKSFFPGELFEIKDWELVPYFKPARQVAGDFYDVFMLPGGGVGLVVADVCDKGVGAALFMALFRSLIRVFSGRTMLEGYVLPSQEVSAEMLETEQDLLEMTDFGHLKTLNAVKLTNNYIALNHSDLSMFATVFFAVLNTENGLLSYINGGHEPVVVMHPDGGVKEYLTPTGPAVGVMPDVDYIIRQTILKPGQTMLAYTDGVTEALSADEKEFTRERLMTLVDKKFTSCEELLKRIADRLNTHMEDTEQFDDITLLALRRL